VRCVVCDGEITETEKGLEFNIDTYLVVKTCSPECKKILQDILRNANRFDSKVKFIRFICLRSY
jgi:predicted nucleic acid-binding Zn ribbon protein